MFVGTLGGFTAFSACANETAYMGQNARLTAAPLNIALQVVVGLLAVGLAG